MEESTANQDKRRDAAFYNGEIRVVHSHITRTDLMPWLT